MKSNITTHQFIERALLIHGDKYDYSKSTYINRATKIIIGCSIHGDFLQRPSDHWNKQGCPSCAGVKKGTTKIFSEKATKIHNNKYNYVEFEYKNNSTPGIIICPKHGRFHQTPNNHLNSHGCPKCKSEKASESLRSNTEEFIH